MCPPLDSVMSWRPLLGDESSLKISDDEPCLMVVSECIEPAALAAARASDRICFGGRPASPEGPGGFGLVPPVHPVTTSPVAAANAVSSLRMAHGPFISGTLSHPAQRVTAACEAFPA
jgi:hypothetical protein